MGHFKSDWVISYDSYSMVHIVIVFWPYFKLPKKPVGRLLLQTRWCPYRFHFNNFNFLIYLCRAQVWFIFSSQVQKISTEKDGKLLKYFEHPDDLTLDDRQPSGNLCLWAETLILWNLEVLNGWWDNGVKIDQKWWLVIIKMVTWISVL